MKTVLYGAGRPANFSDFVFPLMVFVANRAIKQEIFSTKYFRVHRMTPPDLFRIYPLMIVRRGWETNFYLCKIDLSPNHCDAKGDPMLFIWPAAVDGSWCCSAKYEG